MSTSVAIFAVVWVTLAHILTIATTARFTVVLGRWLDDKASFPDVLRSFLTAFIIGAGLVNFYLRIYIG